MQLSNLLFSVFLVASARAQTAMSSCTTPTLVVPKPSNLRCGTMGNLTQPYNVGSSTTVTMEECAGLCLSTDGCWSFGYTTDTSKCQLLGRPLYQQGYLDKTSNLGNVYYHRNCYSCSSSSSSSTASSVKTSSSYFGSASTTTSQSFSSASADPSSTQVRYASGPTTTVTSHSSTYSASTSSSISKSSTLTSTKTLTQTATLTIDTTTATFTTGCATITASPNSTDTANETPGTYYQYFFGTGVTLSSSNPGNDVTDLYPPVSSYLNGTYSSDCDAIQACATLTFDATSINYYSFDLHFDNSTRRWECVSYFDGNNQTDYWSVGAEAVMTSYGYTFIGAQD